MNAPKLWMYPIQFFVSLGWFALLLPAGILGFVMVPLGMMTGWKYKITWLWDNYANNGQYADHWWYKEQHWSWRISPKLAEFWWRAVRNRFSNGSRYAIKNSEPSDVWVNPNSHFGKSYKGPQRIAFMHKPKPYPKTLFYYAYDTKRWWLARFIFTWFHSDKRYFQIYYGWKFDRAEGFGHTFRIWDYRNEDLAS